MVEQVSKHKVSDMHDTNLYLNVVLKFLLAPIVGLAC